MPSRTVILELPDEIYDRVQRQAKQAHRPLEAELLEVIVTSVQQADELPSELSTMLDQLRLLDNRTLAQLADSRLSADESSQLEALNLKQQGHGLDTDERQRRDALLRQYERCLLIRAEAVGLLHGRGIEVAKLAPE